MSKKSIAYIALGSNVGSRMESLNRAWSYLQERLGRIVTSSSVYETAPWGITEQRNFFNAIIGLETDHSPLSVLSEVKKIEKEMGRKKRVKNGPREIDLDVILHGSAHVSFDTLQVPHPRAAQRNFVIAPLVEAVAKLKEKADQTETEKDSLDFVQRWLQENVDPVLREPNAKECRRLLLPLDTTNDTTWQANEATLVMGIINATPDSFSDGGALSTLQDAVDFGQRLVDQGADMLDIGGESTRPGAIAPSVETELSRVIPLIQALTTKMPNIPLSIDTRRAHVAKEAALNGVAILNDVSGGRFDRQLLPTLAQDCPGLAYIATHSRGDPTNMVELATYIENNVAQTAAQELFETTLSPAATSGIAPWRLIADPGLGFAKNIDQNLELMQDIAHFKQALSPIPLLVGPSRKSFIGHIIQHGRQSETPPPPSHRDSGTAGACCALIPSADIVRVHDVRGVKDALLLADAITRKQNRPPETKR